MNAETIRALRGALLYGRRYRGRTFVVKVGGGVLAREGAAERLAEQLALLDSLSIRVVVVHGGGPQVTAWSRRLGIEPRVVAGRRVTPPEVLEVSKMVAAGSVRIDLVARLVRHGVRAVGLTGIDGALLALRRRPPVRVRDDRDGEATVDFGEVGDVVSCDPSLPGTLLEAGAMPVIAPLGIDGEGRPLNVNADTVAEALAVAMEAEKLLFLSTAPGILRDPADPSTLVPFATPGDLERMMEDGTITGGMRPKVEACLRAVSGGVRRTHLLDGTRPDALLEELFTGRGCGTMIVGRREAAEYAAGELPRE